MYVKMKIKYRKTKVEAKFEKAIACQSGAQFIEIVWAGGEGEYLVAMALKLRRNISMSEDVLLDTRL